MWSTFKFYLIGGVLNPLNLKMLVLYFVPRNLKWQHTWDLEWWRRDCTVCRHSHSWWGGEKRLGKKGHTHYSIIDEPFYDWATLADAQRVEYLIGWGMAIWGPCAAIRGAMCAAIRDPWGGDYPFNRGTGIHRSVNFAQFTMSCLVLSNTF